MCIKENMLIDISAELEKEFGVPGTPERAKLEARKEAKVTQSELAKRINTTKSYISRVENGVITPSVAMFYRIIGALGLKIEIVKPIA